MMPLPIVVLETERLILRACNEGDASELFAMYSDEQTMRYWGTPPWIHPFEVSLKLARDQDGLAGGTSIDLGVEERETGRLIGTCALHAFDHANRRCEIGYLLSRSRRGHGLMIEALESLLQHGFGELRLHRIEADVDPDNAASLRLLERLGFRCEGRLRERWRTRDRFSDSQMYGLLASDRQAFDGPT